MHFVEQSSRPRKSISEIAKKNNTSGYHPEIESTRDMRTPAIANSYGHHGQTLDSVTATMWPKASAPSTTSAIDKRTTRKNNAVMADKPAKPIDNARYKEGKVSYSQNRYECKHIRLYAYLPHTHIYVYIYAYVYITK